ncbi:MAG TPA: hypothetical protein H9932_13395 [Candidatus Brachybacterium intestinipullorum]|uniref:Uncharacterized protein n=1 Tax=Candidatus Brachybacterium intestinipullorum TaxID=2838512 RepID=A0A9D2Q0H0_9MICO|nr:hypothetical protein [Candidatus Brachybacterium intestinipullorum]
MRKTALLLSALALSTLPLAACGGGAEDAPAQDPAPTAAEDTVREDAPEEVSDGGGEPAAEEPEASVAEEEPEASSAEESEASAGGPAAEDTVIPAEAVADPPQEVGEFSLMDGSGPAHMYSHAEESILISVDSTVLSSEYETLAEEIATDNAPAGTGSCGTNESGSSIVCYQRTEDGVITVTAIPEEISLEDTVAFVDQYAEQAGAA